LVDRAGSVTYSRFDSPSVFARLLDPQAGHQQIQPSSPWTTERRYLDRTLVLESTFTTPERNTDPHRSPAAVLARATTNYDAYGAVELEVTDG
jgi:hypothetical protein